MKNRVRNLSSGVLRAMDGWLDGLPAFVMPALREAIKQELLARELAALADDSGGHPVTPIRGVQ